MCARLFHVSPDERMAMSTWTAVLITLQCIWGRAWRIVFNPSSATRGANQYIRHVTCKICVKIGTTNALKIENIKFLEIGLRKAHKVSGSLKFYFETVSQSALILVCLTKATHFMNFVFHLRSTSSSGCASYGRYIVWMVRMNNFHLHVSATTRYTKQTRIFEFIVQFVEKCRNGRWMFAWKSDENLHFF